MLGLSSSASVAAASSGSHLGWVTAEIVVERECARVVRSQIIWRGARVSWRERHWHRNADVAVAVFDPAQLLGSSGRLENELEPRPLRRVGRLGPEEATAAAPCRGVQLDHHLAARKPVNATLRDGLRQQWCEIGRHVFVEANVVRLHVPLQLLLCLVCRRVEHDAAAAQPRRDGHAECTAAP